MKDGPEDKHVLGSAGLPSPLSFVGVVVLLFAWMAVSAAGSVNELLLPSPLRVLLAARDIGTVFVSHVLATALRTVTGLVLGTAIGVSAGISMQFNRSAFLVLDGLVETARPIPPVALVPFFILLFGFSEVGKVLLVSLGTALVMVVTTVEALERVPPGVVRWGLVLGLSRSRLFRRVLLPAALPEMRTGIRISLATAITLVVVSEFMGATYGLGYLINVSKLTLSTPTIILTILILGYLSWTLDRLLRYAFDRLCAWDVRAKGAVL